MGDFYIVCNYSKPKLGNHRMTPMHSGGRTANSTPMKSHDEAKIGQTNLQKRHAQLSTQTHTKTKSKSTTSLAE